MIIYGINPVAEAVRAGRASELLVQDARNERLRVLVAEARAAGVTVKTLPLDAFRRIVPAGVHQGVAARVRPAPAASLDDLARPGGDPPLIVVLDGVEDPHNLGAILRSVHAAGGSGVVRQSRHAAPLDGAAAKASAGAVHHVQVRAAHGTCAHPEQYLRRSRRWNLALLGFERAVRFPEDHGQHGRHYSVSPASFRRAGVAP